MPKNPFHPERELMPAADAAKIRADLDDRWNDLETNGFYANGGDKKYQELMLDEFFAPFEVQCPILAEYFRRSSQ